VPEIGARSTARVQSLKSKLENEQKVQRDQVEASLASLEALLQGAQSDVGAVFSELTAAEESHAQLAAAQGQDLQLFERRAQDTAKGLSERLAAQQVDREHKLEFISGWQSGLHGRSAQTLERLMQVLLLLVQSSTKRFAADKAETDAFGQKIKSTVQSDAAQQLRSIRTADRIVDKVLRKDTELANWTRGYDNSTTAWRESVVASLKNLTSEVDAELARKEAEAAGFDADLYEEERKRQMQGEAQLKAQAAAEERQLDKAKAAAAEQMTAVRKQFSEDTAADAAAEKQAEFEIAGRLREAAEAEKDMLAQRGKLEAFVNSSTGVAQTAAKNILHILDTKQAQVDAAQERVKQRIDRLNYIAAGVPPGAASLAERGEGPQAVAGWAESRELLAEHRRLAARARQLEAAAGRALQRHAP